MDERLSADASGPFPSFQPGYAPGMWLYMIAAVLLVIGIIGGILTGGVFLIVFIPLGFIMLVVAAATGALARGAERRSASGSGAPGHVGEPLPPSVPESPAHVPTSPDALVDARRREQ